MSAMPPFVPTDRHREKVRELAGAQMRQDDIARALGIGVHTLLKHFRLEVEQGRAEGIGAVLGALHKNAVVHNNVIAQIFIAKCHGGFQERVDINHNHSGTVTVTHEERLRQLAADPDERPMLEHDGPAEEMPDLDPAPKDRNEAA